MFSSIMASKPIVNPHYRDVKPYADRWITKIMQADEECAAKNSKMDLCYLASVTTPDADEEALRVVVDWNKWVFLFDDQFDEGHLSNDPIAAQKEIDKTIALMGEMEPPVQREADPIRWLFQNMWNRVKKRTTPDLQQRFKDMHKRYFDGLLTQVNAVHQGRVLQRSVQEYMDSRRGAVGAYPAIVLTEYAHGVKLQQEIVDHPSLQECLCVTADLVLLVNDILSYRKDLALGVDINLISILTEKGLSTQQAMDMMDVKFNDCYKRWYNALANMPVWGEEIDREVLKFVEACRLMALGNLYWSFKTGRYLGDEGSEVRKTRMLNLPS